MKEIFSKKVLDLAKEGLEKLAQNFARSYVSDADKKVIKESILMFYCGAKYADITQKYSMNKTWLQGMIRRFREWTSCKEEKAERIVKLFESLRIFYYKDYCQIQRSKQRRQRNQ